MLSNSPKLDKLPKILDVRTRPGFYALMMVKIPLFFIRKNNFILQSVAFFSDLFLVLKIFYHDARFYF